MAGRELKIIAKGSPVPDGAFAVVESEDENKTVLTYMQGKDNRTGIPETERRKVRGTGTIVVYHNLPAARKALKDSEELDAINAALHDKGVKEAAGVGNSSTGKPSEKAQKEKALSVIEQIAAALKRGDTAEALRLSALK